MCSDVPLVDRVGLIDKTIEKVDASRFGVILREDKTLLAKTRCRIRFLYANSTIQLAAMSKRKSVNDQPQNRPAGVEDDGSGDEVGHLSGTKTRR